MSTNDSANEIELARLIARQRILVAQLVAIRDAIVRPQRHSTVRRGQSEGQTREEDRQAYAATLVEFSEWCLSRDVSFPLTLKRMVELVMGRIDVEPQGELTDRIDGVAGTIRDRLDEAGRSVA